MKAENKFILLALLFCGSGFAQSQALAPTMDQTILDGITSAMTLASISTILPQAIIMLSGFMALQFVITNFALLKSGADLDAVMAKFVGSMMWFGFCVYVISNGPQFIDLVGRDAFNTFAPNVPTPGEIITKTLQIGSFLLIGMIAAGTSVLGIGNSAFAGFLSTCMFLVLGIGASLAFKIMMLYLELGLIVLLSPLSFSFLGLNALKDQGIAPFKSLISLFYRIVLLGVIFAAFRQVSNDAAATFHAFSWADVTTWAAIAKSIVSTVTAYVIFAFFVWKADAIASTLAGGGSSLGTGDIATAAAAGAAAGALMAASGTAAASKVPSMGDFVKNLMGGGGGSVSNASSSGQGPAMGSSLAPPMPSSESPGSGGGPLNSTENAGKGFELPASESTSGPNLDTPNTGGSGTNAGVGGAGNLVSQGGNRKPTLRELFANANHQVGHEKSSTHVSINTHHAD